MSNKIVNFFALITSNVCNCCVTNSSERTNSDKILYETVIEAELSGKVCKTRESTWKVSFILATSPNTVNKFPTTARAKSWGQWQCYKTPPKGRPQRAQINSQVCWCFFKNNQRMDLIYKMPRIGKGWRPLSFALLSLSPSSSWPAGLMRLA